MMIKDGNIVPGKGIYPFFIGMLSEELIKMLNGEHSIENRRDGVFVLSVENAKFFFNKKKRLYQIGVSYGFESKFEGKIGIGNTMTDILKAYEGYFKEYDLYLIKGIDNLSFELGDTDDAEEWNELEAPIEWIWVYDMNVKYASQLIHQQMT